MDEDIEYIRELIKLPLLEGCNITYKLDKKSAKVLNRLISRLEQLEKESLERKNSISKEILNQQLCTECISNLKYIDLL